MISIQEARAIIDKFFFEPNRGRGAIYTEINDEDIEEFDWGWLIYCYVKFDPESGLSDRVYTVLVDRETGKHMQSSAGDFAIAETAVRLIASRKYFDQSSG